MPMTPPFAAILRNCSSLRFRLLSHVPFTPVCETTKGRVATATTSSIVAAEACARSTSIPRASIRRIISGPLYVSAVFGRPDDDEASARALGRVVELAHLIERALAQAPHRAQRPALGDSDGGDAVEPLGGGGVLGWGGGVAGGGEGTGG